MEVEHAMIRTRVIGSTWLSVICGLNTMSEIPNTNDCAKWLKALGEPIRLQIVQALLNGPLTVTAITEAVQVEIATASHHLQVLLHAGLVLVEKQGRFSVYQLNPEFLAKRASNQQTFDFGCCKFELAELRTKY